MNGGEIAADPVRVELFYAFSCIVQFSLCMVIVNMLGCHAASIESE